MTLPCPPAVRFMLAVFAGATVWSVTGPVDWATWFFEWSLGAAGVLALVAVYPRYRFSSLVYVVAAIHFVVLAVGARYTYAEVPWFNWLRDTLGLSRNYYDRVGHFFQGVTPALVAREVLLRSTGLGRGWCLPFLVVCVALAFSAFYEMIEWWWVVAFYASSGPEWLGMQGDPWDAQQDMFMALCGAVATLLLLSRRQDRSIDLLNSLPGNQRGLQ
jgi:putative membrane protein